MPSSRSTASIRTTGASLESSIAATIALSLAISRLRSNCSRDPQSSTSNKVLRLSRSEYRRASKQPGATRVGPSIEPSVRNNAVRLSSGTTICIENTIKVHIFRSLAAMGCPNFLVCLHRKKRANAKGAARLRRNIRWISGILKAGCEQLHGQLNQILREFGAPPNFRRSPVGGEPELLDTGFECRWLDVKKRRSSI